MNDSNLLQDKPIGLKAFEHFMYADHHPRIEMGDNYRFTFKIWVITTGGTIEKTYSEDEGSLENRESLLRNKLLSKLRLPTVDVQVKAIMAKDSLLMDEADRQKIADCLANYFDDAHGILVLHGTDTLDKSLEFCHNAHPNPPIPIVFTGAMKPAGFDDSDALQNFTEALYATQIMEAGYYTSFHGQLFMGKHINKNRDKRTFEGELFKT